MKITDGRGRTIEGCAICGSTWGNYWEEVGGERRFFCCDLCALELKNALKSLRRSVGAEEKIEELSIEGDYRGRTLKAVLKNGSSRSFLVRFDSKGETQSFEEVGRATSGAPGTNKV